MICGISGYNFGLHFDVNLASILDLIFKHNKNKKGKLRLVSRLGELGHITEEGGNRGPPGGSPGTPGSEKQNFSITFDTNGVAMARHGLRICVYRATAPKKLLNTLRGFRDNVKNLKTNKKTKT